MSQAFISDQSSIQGNMVFAQIYSYAVDPSLPFPSIKDSRMLYLPRHWSCQVCLCHSQRRVAMPPTNADHPLYNKKSNSPESVKIGRV